MGEEKDLPPGRRLVEFFTPFLLHLAAEQLVRNVIPEEGGPLIHNGWEDAQRSFDSTCRKFYRFLTQTKP